MNKNILLVGNPNVGKSSIFNRLTHSHEHTGNWTGKTVKLARKNIININSKEVKCLYNPVIYDIEKIRKIIKDVYPSSNSEVDILKKAIDELNKKLDQLKKNN